MYNQRKFNLATSHEQNQYDNGDIPNMRPSIYYIYNYLLLPKTLHDVPGTASLHNKTYKFITKCVFYPLFSKIANLF